MSKAGAPRHDPVPIGDVATPAFVRLPDPPSLFAARAARLDMLAQGHDLAPYLLFLAGLADAQRRVLDGLPEPDLPPSDALSRAHEFGMPPLDRNRLTAEHVLHATLERLLGLAQEVVMPQAASMALARVIAADEANREDMLRSVLMNSIPVEALAEHAFVAAALQVHFARLAAGLDPKSLVPVGDGVCPACGGPPVASMVVGWHGAHGARYCVCSLCGTLWNHVRIKCTLCAATKGIGYQEVDGGAGTIKAETCDNCRSYVKILQHHKDSRVDPIADDVASLGLDILMRDTGYRRGGVNPFLLGY